MDEYKRRRRRSRAVMSMFLDSLGGSIDNVDVATFDSDGTDLKALIVGIEPVQSGTGDPSPDNIRPITGHSSVNVIVSPTLNPLDGTITNIPLGGTYYGGQLDVLTGVLTVDRWSYVFDGSYLGSMSTSPLYPHLYTVGAIPYIGVQQPFDQNYCSHYKPLAGNFNESCFYLQTPASQRNVSFNDMRFTTAAEYQNYFIAQYAAGTPVTVCYRLETPQTFQLTGQQIATFLGTNNVWCDSGKIIHLEY